MGVALTAISPIMMLIGLGFLAVRQNWVNEHFVSILNRYVMLFAAPALLFRNTALTDFPPSPPWGLWLGYYGSMFCLFWITVALSFIFAPSRNWQERFVLAFGSGFSNTIMLGIPIVLTAFGSAAELPLFLILAFHGVFFLSFMTFCMEVAQPRGVVWANLWRSILTALARQNVLIAVVAGVSYGLMGFALPSFIDQFLRLLGESAIPAALMMSGAILAGVKVRRSVDVAVFVVILKLIIHPLLAYSFGRYIFGLPDLWVAVMTVLAAMPSGLFTTIFAENYKAAPGAASSIIVISTVAAAVTLTFVLSLFADFLH